MECPVMHGMPTVAQTALHISRNSSLQRIFLLRPLLYSHRKESELRGEALKWLEMAIVALNGLRWSRRKTVAPLKRVVLVQGSWISDALLFTFTPDHVERRGMRLGSKDDGVAGSNSPKRHWPHHAETAMARAHRWRGEPSFHALASREIIDDLIGGRWRGFLTSRGQNSVSALLMRPIHSGRFHGRHRLTCHERRADRLFLAVPGPVRPNPSQTNRRRSSSDAGRACASEKPMDAANFM
jgi:hypothetical protein